MTLLPKEKLNNFDVVIPALGKVDKGEELPRPRQENPEPPIRMGDQSRESVPDTTPVPDIAPDITPVQEDTQTPIIKESQDRYALRKRKPNPDDTLEERQAKIVKAMLAIAQSIDVGPEEVALLAAVGVETIPIPNSYIEAVNHPQYGSQWRAAIQQEIASLEANDTWEEEVRPGGANLVSTKWVFTVKLNVDGSVERFKVRLVARGFSQI